MKIENLLKMLDNEASTRGLEGSYQQIMCSAASACILEKVKLAEDTEQALSRALELIDKKSKQIDVLKAALAENGKYNARQLKKKTKERR